MGFSGWRVDFPNYFPVFDSEISKLLGKHANGYELQPVLANLKYIFEPGLRWSYRQWPAYARPERLEIVSLIYWPLLSAR